MIANVTAWCPRCRQQLMNTTGFFNSPNWLHPSMDAHQSSNASAQNKRLTASPLTLHRAVYPHWLYFVCYQRLLVNWLAGWVCCALLSPYKGNYLQYHPPLPSFWCYSHCSEPAWPSLYILIRSTITKYWQSSSSAKILPVYLVTSLSVGATM